MLKKMLAVSALTLCLTDYAQIAGSVPGNTAEKVRIENIKTYLNSIGKVDGISGIWLQRIFQCNNYLLTICFNYRLLHLRRRDNNLFSGFVQLDKFVELDGYLIAVAIHLGLPGRTTNEHRRFFIDGATL